MEVQKGLNIRFIDSLNFLPMGLAELPKAFDLTELSKGHWPFYFNTKSNQNYIGPYPSMYMYGVNSMSKIDRSDFLTWYATLEGKVFDFRKEMKAYCISDVVLLREACLKFQALMMEVTESVDVDLEAEDSNVTIDPFGGSVTIASLCMNIFKSIFWKPYERVQLSNGEWYTSQTSKDDVTSVTMNGKWNTEKELKQQGLTVTDSKSLPSAIAQIPSQCKETNTV
jgi:hypothetical protein